MILPALREDNEVSETIRTGYKVFTHHLCSPIQGGAPLFDGACPTELPAVALDTGGVECGPGWNYTADLATAFRIGGLWPTGRPSRAFVVEASADAIERGDKRRASRLTIVRAVTPEEERAALRSFSRVFGDHAERMTDEQLAWRRALARPRSNPAAVAASLESTLRARGLDRTWALKEYKTAWAAWAAGAAWDAWAARAAWAAWAAWATGDAWAAWAAGAARAALTVCYAALNALVKELPEHLTAGLREAYENGLGVAIPTLPNVLGWAMDGEKR